MQYLNAISKKGFIWTVSCHRDSCPFTKQYNANETALHVHKFPLDERILLLHVILYIIYNNNNNNTCNNIIYYNIYIVVLFVLLTSYLLRL